MPPPPVFFCKSVEVIEKSEVICAEFLKSVGVVEKKGHINLLK